MAVVEYVVGSSGTGKSYVRGVVALLEYWLPNTDRTIWTNLPFNFPELEKLFERYPKWRGRVQIIPEEELEAWRTYQRGPWDFFSGERAKNIHVLIDEAQNYFSDEPLHAGLSEVHAAYMVKLDDWMGQYLRKNNASFEAMTQSEQKLTRKVLGDAGVRRRMLTASETTWFGVRLADVVGLWSKFYGKKQGVAVERIEVRKGGGKGQSAWTFSRQDIHWLSEYNWRYYNSYNKPGTTDDNGVKPDKEEWEVLSWPGYINTLVWRYWLLIAKTTCVSAGAIAFMIMAANLALSVTKVVGKDPKTGKPKSQAAEPTPVDDPQYRALLIKEGLSDNTAHRLKWPVEARNLTREHEKQIRELKAELLKTQNTLTMKTNSLTQLLAVLKRDAEIVAVTPDSAVQADGRVLRVGEVITGGLFDGRKILSIDGDTVVFDRGLRVRPSLVRKGAVGEGQATEFQFTDPTVIIERADQFPGNLSPSGKLAPVPDPASSGTTGPGLVAPSSRSGADGSNSVLGDGGNGRRVSPVSGTQSQGVSRSASGNRAAGTNRGVRRSTQGGSLQPVPAPQPVGSSDGGEAIQPEPTLAD